MHVDDRRRPLRTFINDRITSHGRARIASGVHVATPGGQSGRQAPASVARAPCALEAQNSGLWRVCHEGSINIPCLLINTKEVRAGVLDRDIHDLEDTAL